MVNFISAPDIGLRDFVKCRLAVLSYLGRDSGVGKEGGGEEEEGGGGVISSLAMAQLSVPLPSFFIFYIFYFTKSTG